jgi:hypothetical protein
MAPHIIDLPVWALDLGFPLKTSSAGGRYFLKDDGDAMKGLEAPPKSLPPSPGHDREWLDCIKSRRKAELRPGGGCKIS